MVRLAAGLILLFSIGCSDIVEPDLERTSVEYSRIVIPTDSTTEWPVKIHWAVASAQFPTGNYPAQALVEGGMSYNGYHASIAATVFLRGTTSDTRTYDPVETFSNTFRNNVHTAVFPMMVPTNCGHTIEGRLAYLAWWEAVDQDLDRPILEEVPAAKNTAAVQQGCIKEEERTVPRSGGGDDCVTCVEEPVSGYCRVRVKYRVDTGEILSWTVLYCT